MSVTAVFGAQRARARRVYRGWWIVVLAFYAGLLSTAGGGYVFGALILSMQQTTGWSQSTLVGPITVNRWLSGLLAVPLGPLVDRHGARMLMTVSAVVAGVGLIAVSFAQTTLMFYVAWALFGLAQPGLGQLGPRVVIANWFVRKRAKAFVLFTLGSSAAGLFAVPAAAVIDERYGWRVVWLILGVLCLSIAPLSWWAIRRRPEDIGLLPDGATPGAEPDASPAGIAAAAAALAAERHPWTVRQALRTRSFWFLTIGFLLVAMPSGAIFINISGFVQTHGFSSRVASFVVATYALGSFGARPLWGFFLGRVGLHRTLVVFAATYAVAIGVFSMQSGLYQLFAGALFLGFGISGSQLLNAQALPDYFGRNIVGALTGYSTLANVAIGGSAPQLTALVFDRTGEYTPVFLFFAVACAVAAVSFVFSPPPAHPHQDRNGTALEDAVAR